MDVLFVKTKEVGKILPIEIFVSIHKTVKEVLVGMNDVHVDLNGMHILMNHNGETYHIRSVSLKNIDIFTTSGFNEVIDKISNMINEVNEAKLKEHLIDEQKEIMKCIQKFVLDGCLEKNIDMMVDNIIAHEDIDTLRPLIKNIISIIKENLDPVIIIDTVKGNISITSDNFYGYINIKRFIEKTIDISLFLRENDNSGEPFKLLDLKFHDYGRKGCGYVTGARMHLIENMPLYSSIENIGRCLSNLCTNNES